MEVGQPDAAERFPQLQEVKETAAVTNQFDDNINLASNSHSDYAFRDSCGRVMSALSTCSNWRSSIVNSQNCDPRLATSLALDCFPARP